MGEGLFGVLPGGWEETTLGDVCRRGGGKIQTGPFGSQLHASDYVPVGIPTVMPANIGDNRIVEDGIARVSESDAQRLARHRLQLGDIVYSRRGDVERRALVRQHEVGWLCGTGSLLVRTGNKFADPVYLSLWLGHPQVRAWITQHAVGATMANLNTEILSDVPVVVPPIAEQRAIAGVLGALDDKIESNRRLSALLDDLLMLSYERLADQQSTALVRLGELLTPAIGGAWGEDAASEKATMRVACLRGIDLVSLAANELPNPPARWLSPKQYEARRVAGAEIWVEGSGSFCGRSFLVGAETQHLFRDPICYSNFVKRLLPQNDPLVLVPAWLALRHAYRSGAVAQYRTGTAFPNLDLGALLSGLEVRVPDHEGLLELRHLADSRLSPAVIRETEALGALRDALLPELLSGRLRVRDAEEMVGSA